MGSRRDYAVRKQRVQHVCRRLCQRFVRRAAIFVERPALHDRGDALDAAYDLPIVCRGDRRTGAGPCLQFTWARFARRGGAATYAERASASTSTLYVVPAARRRRSAFDCERSPRMYGRVANCGQAVNRCVTRLPHGLRSRRDSPADSEPQRRAPQEHRRCARCVLLGIASESATSARRARSG